MKRIFIFMTLAVLTLTLVACGGGSKITFDDWDSLKELEYDGSAVTIEFWHRAGEDNQTMFKKWIKEFNEEYPNITVNEEKAADDYDALANRVALTVTTGKNPDIVESYPDHVARYGSSVLELNNFVDNPNIGYTQAEQDDFLEGLWLEGQSYDNEGTIKSLPFSKSSEALYYNKTMFEKHGHELPEKGFWTWEEIFVIAKDLKEKEKVNGAVFGYDSSDNFFIVGSEQWKAPYTGYDKDGKGEVLFNNDKSKEMIKYFKDKVDKGLMTNRTLLGAYSSDNMKKGEAPFMFVGSTGGARYSVQGVDEALFDGGKGYEVGVAPVPVKDADHRRQIQQGPNINLFKKNDPQRMIAAWLFAKFMLEAERTAEFALQSGYAPVRTSAYETETWKDYASGIKDEPKTVKEAEAKAIYDSIMMFRNNESIFFTSAVFGKSSAARGQAGGIVDAIFAYDGSNLDAFIDEEYQEAYDYITG